MKSMWLFLFGMTSGLLLMGISYEYHFVMSGEGFIFVPKSQSSLKDLYVDIREWTLNDWGEHPEVARALIADGRSELVKTAVTSEVLDTLLPGLGKELEVGKTPGTTNPF